MYNPVATYRVQLHKEFNFAQLLSIVDYLQELGIVTIYASPVFRSVPGSTHGYDGLDPNEINPEIGDVAQLEEIAGKLKERGMGWVQDIVPNHMAFDPGNAWLMDVLEKGESSAYRRYFDISPSEKLMVPFLGNAIEEAIENNELQISWRRDRLVINYFENYYPLNPASYANVIRLCCKDEAAMQIASRIDEMPEQGFSGEWELIRSDLNALRDSGDISLDEEALNADKEILRHILDQQYYRLCHWKETDRHINYRRFFTVNGLICMNAQDPEVFLEYHRLVGELMQKNIFQGLRVDHADGLYDPKRYLQDLRKLSGADAHITIEKILANGEWLPDDWPIEGNTGYDFLSIVNNLQADRNAEKIIARLYSGISRDKETIGEQVRKKKSMILFQHMQGELDNLFHLFCELQLVSRSEIDSRNEDSIKTVIASLLVNMPVYRFYGSSMPLPEDEENAIRKVCKLVRATEQEHAETAYWFEKILLDTSKNADDDHRGRVSHFYKRLMQFSGPLMAKGVEDTLMYTHNRLLSRNEVGDSPEHFGIDVSEFHSLMIDRWERSPLGLNATATHDTKRGEDARARLNVISDIPEEWVKTVREWMQMNASIRQDGSPDANDEYLLYQAMLGSYPLDAAEEEGFPERLKNYLQKALREAKTNSSWSEPNEVYEQNVFRFADVLLDKTRPFWKSFQHFLHEISGHGFINSLAQLVLKFTTPGVPDVYQGCELWDLSFVDPDNRRPVDYAKRKELLNQLRQSKNIGELWKERVDGRIKLWLTQRLLSLRKEHNDIFTAGGYVPLSTEGKYAGHVLAYGRKLSDVMLVTVLPLHTASLRVVDVNEFDWEDTRIILPPGSHPEKELLAGSGFSGDGEVWINNLFNELPAAVLQVKVRSKDRKAGVLLHVTSLPSAFGIGDMGPGAMKFVAALHRGAQKIWQVLPLNPTSEGQAHSPYSAMSSMAGNPLLISPDLMLANGWLDPADLNYSDDDPDKVTFAKIEKWKHGIFQKAWRNFEKHDHSGFHAFCEKEDHWLHDFALYMLLKEMHDGRSWNHWPDEWKMRNRNALDDLASQQQDRISYIKWLQFVFHLQWTDLKQFANGKGISIVGDLPFYVSYDSADVWVNRELFALGEDGEMLAVAGVPPDAFSSDGQLWGMPVFSWQKLRESNFKWWVDRIRKNRELFDAVRLDHFRAFSAYWEVDAKEGTAKNGKWVESPGRELFEVLRSAIGDLSFIAEDLGDIDEPVRELLWEYQLPGMKVLQFAFGDDGGSSEFLPHHHAKNFVVYTGTHDNNTVRGWWENEADAKTKERVMKYAGMKFTGENVADYFCRLAYSSVADNVIIPVQDIIGLGSEARMNRPSSIEDNWSWRLLPGQITSEIEMKLRKWTRIYNR